MCWKTIKRTCDYAVENEAEFRETVCSISEEQQGELSVRLEKRLAKKQKRVNEVNRLIKKLYEDNISGKLNDKRFNAMLKLIMSRSLKRWKRILTEIMLN